MVMNEFKKGIWAIVVIALIGGALAIALSDFRNDIVEDFVSTSSVINESLTLSNGVAVNLANNYVVSVTSVFVNNTGTWQDLGAENWTAGSINSEAAGTITLDDSAYDGNESRVTYTYRDEFSIQSTNSTYHGLVGAGNATSYLGEIGTIIAVMAMIGIIWGAFYFFRR